MELQLLGLISQYGVWGAAFALVGWIGLQLWRDLKASWELRLTESRQLLQVIETTNKAYTALASSNELRAKANETMAQAQLSTTQTLVVHMESIKRVEECQQRMLRELDVLHTSGEKMRDTIKDLTQEVARLHRRQDPE